MVRSIRMPSQRRNHKRRRNRHKNGGLGVIGHRHLHNIGRVRAEHHQLAVRHVDDAHDAERNRQSDGDQHEHGPKAQSKKQRFDAGIERAPPADGFHRSRGGLPHLRVAFDEAAVGRFARAKPAVCSAHPGGGCGGAWQSRQGAPAASEPSSAASARAVAISFFTLESVSTLLRSRNSCTLPSSKSFSMSCTASKRTDASGLDNPKRASVVCKMRRKWLFVPILVRSSDRGGTGAFQGERIDQIERR